MERARAIDAYSLTYAFSFLLFILALVAISPYPVYGYDRFGYTILLVSPPVLGVLGALLAERSGRPIRRTLASAALLSVLSLLGSVTLATVGSLLLVPLNPLFTSRNFGALTVAAVVLVALIASPLVVTLVRQLRHREPGAALRALVILLALAGIAAIMLLTVNSHALVETLRKDQIVQLMAGLFWYLPTYGLATALWRSAGIAA